MVYPNHMKQVKRTFRRNSSVGFYQPGHTKSTRNSQPANFCYKENSVSQSLNYANKQLNSLKERTVNPKNIKTGSRTKKYSKAKRNTSLDAKALKKHFNNYFEKRKKGKTLYQSQNRSAIDFTTTENKSLILATGLNKRKKLKNYFF